MIRFRRLAALALALFLITACTQAAATRATSNDARTAAGSPVRPSGSDRTGTPQSGLTTTPDPSGPASPGSGSSGTGTTGSGTTGSGTSGSTKAAKPPAFHRGPIRTLAAVIGTEASGLARSTHDERLFFTVDDGAGERAVSMVDTQAKTIGRVTLAGANFTNAEAVATGPCGTADCLYVGDIGDNKSRRASVIIYRIPEPKRDTRSATPVTVEYHYPDGAYDAESLMIDPGGRPVIITKPAEGKAAHRIYRGEPGGGTLQLVTTFRPPAPLSPMQSLLTGTVATDASFDGHRVLLLTYDQVIEYRAPAGTTDPATFPSWPHRELPFPRLDQAEGIAGLADGRGYAVVSEAGPLGDRSTLRLVRWY